MKSKIPTVLFILYIVVLITLLVIPTSGTLKLNKTIWGIRTDHVIHATLFLPFMGYIWISNLHKRAFSGFLKFYLAGILFAAFCESLHYFIPYRSFDVHDFYANVTGLSIGCIIFIFRSPEL